MATPLFGGLLFGNFFVPVKLEKNSYGFNDAVSQQRCPESSFSFSRQLRRHTRVFQGKCPGRNASDMHSRVYCIRQKIKRQKIKRQKTKTKKIKRQKNQKAEKSKGRKSKGRKSEGRKSHQKAENQNAENQKAENQKAENQKAENQKAENQKAENQKTALNGNIK